MRKLAEKSRTLCIMAQPMISPLPTPPPVNLLCSKDVKQMNLTIEGEEKRSRRTTANIHCRLRRHSRNVKLCYISFTSSFLSTSCYYTLQPTPAARDISTPQQLSGVQGSVFKSVGWDASIPKLRDQECPHS